MPFDLFQLKYLGYHLWHVCHYSETSILYTHVCHFPATVVHFFQSQEIAHKNSELLCMISGFRHNVEEICALFGYYAAQNGNSVLMFWDILSGPFSRDKKSKKNVLLDFLATENGTDRLSQSVGME